MRMPPLLMRPSISIISRSLYVCVCVCRAGGWLWSHSRRPFGHIQSSNVWENELTASRKQRLIETLASLSANSGVYDSYMRSYLPNADKASSVANFGHPTPSKVRWLNRAHRTRKRPQRARYEHHICYTTYKLHFVDMATTALNTLYLLF